MVKYESTDYGYEVVHHDRLYLKKRYLIKDIVKVSAKLSINAYKIMNMASGRVLVIDAVKHVKVDYTTNLYDDKGVKAEEMHVPVTLYVNLKPDSKFNKLEAQVKKSSIERMDDESYIITMNILIRPIYCENKIRNDRRPCKEDNAFEYSTGEEKCPKKSRKSKKSKDSVQIAVGNKGGNGINSNTQIIALILLLMLVSMYVQSNKARCMYCLP